MTQTNPSPSDSPDESRPAEAPESADTVSDQAAEQSPDRTADDLDSSAWTATGEDLPELEELTPELVEEEAIRGDFMLRGAAILLALLFGFLQIADSRVLVHIRSGEEMRENGFLPARTDTFSFANEGEPTANVSWLFDHLVSGVWAIGGPLGLTLFKALTAGFIAWVLTRISVPGLPTWWSSICGVIALAACASDLMPITDLMTLLGLVLLLKMLHEAYQGHAAGLTWKAPLLIAVWGNLDSHAFLGVIALLLFSAGSGFAQTPGEKRESASPATLWTATALSAVALLINPFPVASALSVVQTYFTEYPGIRILFPLTEATIPLLDGRLEGYSLLNVDAWGGFEFSFIAALTIIFLAGVTVVLARDHREAPWTFLLGGFAALAVATIHELAPAALVAAVVAGVVGQRYYRRTFPQEYTTKPSEVLFSRVGRAVTVFSFALLGFLVVTDRLPTRTAVGTGFTSDFATSMETLEKQLSELPEDARVLHTRVDMGDFLIWSGRQSFIDTRVTPFGVASDPESANQRYRTARQDMLDAATASARAMLASQQEALRAMQNQAAGTDGPDAGADTAPATTPSEDGSEEDMSAETAIQEAMDINAVLDEQMEREGITHAVAGLYPPGQPHVRTMTALSAAPRTWTPIGLDSSAAVFAYVKGLPEADRPEIYNPISAAFRDIEPEMVTRFEFATPKGFYDEYLYRTRASVSEEMRIARNHLSLRSTPENLFPALRAMNRLLARDEQNAEAFYVQAMIYSQLANWESQVSRQAGGANPADMRYIQILMAARQAVTIDPDMGKAWNLLYQVYVQRGRVDLALECFEKASPFLRQTLQATAGDNEQASLEQLDDAQKNLAETVAQIELQREELLKQNPATDPNQRTVQKHAIAEQVASQGHIGAALELLDENKDSLQNVPQLFARAEALRGQLMLEAGRLQEAFELFLQMDAMAKQQQQTEGQQAVLPWTTMSFLSKLGLCAYPQADEEIATHISVLRGPNTASVVIKGNLASLPLVAAIETVPQSDVASRWPVTHLFSCSVPLVNTPQSLALPRLMQAIAEIEYGNVEAARVNLQGLLNECGTNPYRPLAASYLALLRDDIQEYMAENSLNSWEAWDDSDFDDLNEDDAATDESAADGDETSEEKPADDDQSAATETSGEDAPKQSDFEKPSSEEPESPETPANEPADEDAPSAEPDSKETPSDEPTSEDSGSDDTGTEEPADGESSGEEEADPDQAE